MKLVQHRSQPDYSVAPTIIGLSPALKRVLSVAGRIAAGHAKVLITGESGAGKDVIARFIHSESPRAAQRFVALNCASFSEGLLESELFGHVKGSFTGAYRDKIGKLQQADGGTIFLDEIAEMSLRMQALLLRFLENGEIQPVGSDGPPIRADVRVLSATNRDLTQMVAKSEFREDLLYRIKVAHVHVPPLRERKDDVRALIEHTVGKTGKAVIISAEAMNLLVQYQWPGNVRELQNVVEQITALAAGDHIGVDDLPPIVAVPPSGNLHPRNDRRGCVPDELYDALVSGAQHFWHDVRTVFLNRDLTREDLRQLIRRALAATGGNYRGVAQLFGIDPQDYKKLMNFLAAHECVVDYREFRQVNRDLMVPNDLPARRAKGP